MWFIVRKTPHVSHVGDHSLVFYSAIEVLVFIVMFKKLELNFLYEDKIMIYGFACET